LSVVELTPIDDCWVHEGMPDTNYNKKGLGIGRWVDLNRSLVMFLLEGLPISKDEVAKAELWLYGKAIHYPCIVEAHYSNWGWTEETVTWNTQPSLITHHWDDKATSLIGSTTDIPTDTEGWYVVPLELEFIRLRWGRKLSMTLKGYEGAEDSYCYAEDKEASKGAYAPRLRLYAGIPTSLDIYAPDTVKAGEKFTVTGTLTEAETGTPIAGQPIHVSYDGKTLGTAYTERDGSYFLEASIPEAGYFTLKAEYPGSGLYAGSVAVKGLGVSGNPMMAVAPLAVGLGLLLVKPPRLTLP